MLLFYSNCILLVAASAPLFSFSLSFSFRPKFIHTLNLQANYHNIFCRRCLSSHIYACDACGAAAAAALHFLHDDSVTWLRFLFVLTFSEKRAQTMEKAYAIREFVKKQSPREHIHKSSRTIAICNWRFIVVVLILFSRAFICNFQVIAIATEVAYLFINGFDDFLKIGPHTSNRFQISLLLSFNRKSCDGSTTTGWFNYIFEYPLDLRALHKRA